MNTVSLKKKTSFLNANEREWALHALVWVLLIASFAVPDTWTRIFWDNGATLALFTIIIPFYINAHFLIPRYFKRSSWAKYFLLLTVLLLAVNIIKGLLLVLSMEWRGLEYDFYAEFQKWASRDFSSLDRFIFSGTALVLYFSFAYRFIKDWVTYERVKDKLISEKASMELAFFKSQLNPHFLFNSLNNLYAMALEEKAERTADGVAKMGALMRYSLHDAQADFIPLQKELEHIIQYVEMQKLRAIEGGKLKIRINLAHIEESQEKIAPMILIPFIENAFKYGVSTVKESMIRIDIGLSGRELSMQVVNSVHPDIRIEQGGIGLQNVKNRLQLIYPNRHQLECGIKGPFYQVDLKIDLSQ